jgi:hypothetical protein|tara:strand:- start:13725 stop:14636 length:912 start_codon:yes stop_codon:yes gene_type:complete
MAVQETVGLRELQQYMDQGWAPRADPSVYGEGATPDSEMQFAISSKDDLMDWLNKEAYQGRLNFTQQDIYDFFIKPEEQQAVERADERFRELSSQAAGAAGQRTGQMASRLGLAGTSLGQQMGKTTTKGLGSLSKSAGLEAARQAAISGFDRPGRMGRIEGLKHAYQTGGTTRAGLARTGGATAGTLIGSGISLALAAASTGPQAIITAPLAAIIGGITAAASTAVGGAAGLAAEADMLGTMREGLGRFAGRSATPGSFRAAPGTPTYEGATFRTGGSNQRALMGAYGPAEGESDSSFLFGSA